MRLPCLALGAFVLGGASSTVEGGGSSLIGGSFTIGCNIKGNISRTGERIYHVPGQEYYAATRIDRRYGERWFCSEEEARQAGWRKARV